MNVLLILGHPRSNSLGGALFDAFQSGVQAAGLPCHSLRIADLAFDPDVHVDSPEKQRLEPDLMAARELIVWADHLVFIYPTWWGTVPALCKAFLDRMLTPGFAFRHHANGGWDKLLSGKTAQLMTTMDTPPLIHRWIYGNPGIKAMARATLGYCGVRTVRTAIFGPVTGSSAIQRTQWLEYAHQEGRRLGSGALSSRQRWTDRLQVALKALRLQFYPMTFLAYWVGALAALQNGTSIDLSLFWYGYLMLFLLEAATVLSNDVFDHDSDRRNQNAGPFTGGSRVIVDGELSFAEAGRSIAVLLGLFVLLSIWQLSQASSSWATGGWLAALTFCALGYTVPPLKLCHRGLGEFDVALTHSFGVLLFGFLLQGGHWQTALPWALSLPLFFAILPAIVLSGLPDCRADRAAGKRTLVVRLGSRTSIGVAAATTIASTLLASIVQATLPSGQGYGIGIYLIVMHAVYLLWHLHRLALRAELPQRIDSVMVRALSFIIWFVAAPLVMLL